MKNSDVLEKSSIFIAPVFKAPEPFEKDRNNTTGTGISYNATHI